MDIDRRAALTALAVSAATATTSALATIGSTTMAGTGIRVDPSQPAPVRSPLVRPDAEQWDMKSKFTGRVYRILVAKPPAAAPRPPGGYPVIYLNDADFDFHTAADALMVQSIALEVKPAYVVGVGYGKGWETASRTRMADLLPSPPDPATLAAFETSPLTKGATYAQADLFHQFLTEELRPQIEAAYPVDRHDSILWGHSFGGLFALHILFNYPEAYRTYLVNSPSINWNNGSILKDEVNLVAQLAAGKVAPRVLLTAGEFEEKLADHVTIPSGATREQMQAMLTAFGMITHAVGLADRLKAAKAPAGTQVEAIVFDGETHLSVIPGAISRGLRFALPV
ncbi:alpha/beta hydrolase [Sphingosinicella rhizophila]|uniref:Acyl-CoA:diacylglycerol acyltransferase n=1 Tax=Sphingosinicella rhizophila TaxID=3050082 RepID=A0ABU3QC84_9SPHN|nr:alpha/beta hydrolase-fold protein [Sphingosinicella sp. GR2756]MDT9600598.1 alpha/beta hydrolase-fold protein [Sphingosinicella sp. GR2756]